MRRRRLIWQLYPSYLLITLLSLAAVTWMAAGYLKTFYLDETATDLRAKTHLVENQLRDVVMGAEPGSLQPHVEVLSRLAKARITLIAADGRVLADSQEDPLRMENHADRPEVLRALAEGLGTAARHSVTLDENMFYLADVFTPETGAPVVVRLAVPMTRLRQAWGAVYGKVAWGALVIALLAAGLSWRVAHRISSTLATVKAGALRFSQGDLSHALPIPETEEIGGLVEALNQMAAQLNERLHTILRQRSEQEAVLGSMREGVLAVDPDERLIIINSSAAALFHLNPEWSRHRSIQEVVRNPDLQRFVSRTLESSEPLEGELVFYEDEERIMHANGTLLKGNQGQAAGAVIVLNDITRLRRLETIRRDFVANVSHEVKTPVTLIQGFVETLLDGALANPKEAHRFLEIILEQAKRLNAVLEDLLSLSRIEHAEGGPLSREAVPLRGLLEHVAADLTPAAAARKLRFEITCPDTLTVTANASLMEQAIFNLADNAVKYADAGTTVRLEAESVAAGEAVIRVRDEGPGIGAEHLPRLFERFYRVDKSRSRKAGGTGLGLAIVKHIIQLHGGQVRVESAPGRGSVFILEIPQ